MSQQNQAVDLGLGMKIQRGGADRRQHRRHDLESRGIPVGRMAVGAGEAEVLGKLVDISAGGVRIRTNQKNLHADNQIRVRLDLPAYAGISPFISSDQRGLAPRNQWVGWMTIARVTNVDAREVEVAGRLVDMDDIDRGMLGLYLSTQPLAA